MKVPSSGGIPAADDPGELGRRVGERALEAGVGQGGAGRGGEPPEGVVAEGRGHRTRVVGEPGDVVVGVAAIEALVRARARPVEEAVASPVVADAPDHRARRVVDDLRDRGRRPDVAVAGDVAAAVVDDQEAVERVVRVGREGRARGGVVDAGEPACVVEDEVLVGPRPVAWADGEPAVGVVGPGVAGAVGREAVGGVVRVGHRGPGARLDARPVRDRVPAVGEGRGRRRVGRGEPPERVSQAAAPMVPPRRSRRPTRASVRTAPAR
jgi:hypothetical protein